MEGNPIYPSGEPMNDNDLIRLFLPIIQDGLALDFPTVVVKQANQPTLQGVTTGPAVFFYKIGDKRYGFRSATDEWDSNTLTEVHTESQQYETTFQISSLVTQDPTDTTSYTASDLVNQVAYIMQSVATLEILNAQNVGVLRVTDVTNHYFSDDRDQFEANPIFTFTLTHLQTIISQTEVIESVEDIIIPI